MYKMLIVDDERHVVNYLYQLLSQDTTLDLDIYKAYSGHDALDLLHEIKIDIVLLDIHMPGMSGLEAASKIQQSWPNCYILFLTAYDNFEYIYQANQINHCKYLLKTERDEVIINEIHSLLQTLELETKTLHTLSIASQRELLFSNLLQQNVLKQIIYGESLKKLTSQLQLAGSDFPLDCESPVYLLHMDIHPNTLNDYYIRQLEYNLKYLQLMQQILGEQYHYSMVYLESTHYLWILQPTKHSQDIPPIPFLKSVMEDMSTLCHKHLHQNTIFLLYPTLVSWNTLCTRFHKLQDYHEVMIMKQTTQVSYSAILDLTEKENSHASQLYQSTEIETFYHNLTFYLLKGERENYIDLLSTLSNSTIQSKSMHNLHAILLYTAVSMVLMQYVSQHHLEAKISMRTALYPLYYVQNFNTWDQAYQYLLQFSTILFDIIDTRAIDKNERIISSIKEYILSNLSKDLTLAKIAAYMNYNDCYISRLFKTITGTGISEYINSVRLGKAKELLATTSESIQNIATLTGFDTSQYFSSVFKRGVGISPSEYRQQNHTL